MEYAVDTNLQGFFLPAVRVKLKLTYTRWTKLDKVLGRVPDSWFNSIDRYLQKHSVLQDVPSRVDFQFKEMRSDSQHVRVGLLT